ncbi:MAG: galactose-1-phosphate uridylyltransferase [bacterium]
MPKPKNELRKDYIQEKYVIIAPRRSNRPHDTDICKKDHRRSASCVFCPENLKKSDLVIKKYSFLKHNKFSLTSWDIAVLKNKFPAVTLDNPKAYGIQEVIVETPNHALELEELSLEHIAKLLEVYAERTKIISQNKKIEYILIFKNDGGVAGASLQHSHTQIFATDFLPPHLFDKSQRTQAYKLENGTCVYCDVIKKETNGPRMIYKDKYIIAFCPWASIYNYEVWIMPLRHIDNIMFLNNNERKSFAKILKKVLNKIGKLGLPYNYYFHQVTNDEDQHLYMKITPRGSVWAGVEIGSGIVINPIAPEDAAEYYRE